jgi:hypothetical protein
VPVLGDDPPSFNLYQFHSNTLIPLLHVLHISHAFLPVLHIHNRHLLNCPRPRALPGRNGPWAHVLQCLTRPGQQPAPPSSLGRRSRRWATWQWIDAAARQVLATLFSPSDAKPNRANLGTFGTWPGLANGRLRSRPQEPFFPSRIERHPK